MNNSWVSPDFLWICAGPLRVVVWCLSRQPCFEEIERQAAGKPWVHDGTGAHSGRKQEFLASRLMSERLIGNAPWRGNYGEPLWPSPWAGSLSHKSGHVALMACQSRGPAGIDLERCRLFEYGLESKIMDDWERGLVGGIEFGGSAVFSAKESIYKALFPLVKRKFWFDAARLLDVCHAEGHLVMDFAVTSTLSDHVREGLEIRVFGRKVELDGDDYWLTACEGPMVSIASP